MSQVYNKLIRDQIPKIIERDGKKAKTRILEDKEYKKELLKKIVEEAQEVLATSGEKEALTKEIGDVLEIIEYLIKTFNLDPSKIEKVKMERKKSRGGFDQKLFLESTE